MSSRSQHSERDDLVRTHEQIHGDYPHDERRRWHQTQAHQLLGENGGFTAWHVPADPTPALGEYVLTIDMEAGETLLEQRTYRMIPCGDLLAPPVWIKISAKTRADGRVKWLGRYEDAEGNPRFVFGGSGEGWVPLTDYQAKVARFETDWPAEIGVLSKPSISTREEFEQLLAQRAGSDGAGAAP
ncbi:MAG TPA: hypothetical protein VGJ60_34015 [Chloroflexota bacterium]|jgi:hypothetical protein